MKELSIEQKAKAYDKALERVKDFIEKQNPPAFDKDLIGTIFPELQESEDERIRKELIKEINGLWENDSATWPSSLEKKNKYIAWLEKQEGCEHIRKDWLEHIKQSWYKEGFIDGKYSGVKEWTMNDDATLKELIDFLENKTAKLQHDLTRYANWLKIKFTPKKHLE